MPAPGCSTASLLTSLVLSEGGQDIHSSFEAATVILECVFSFPSHLKHTVLDQYTHHCSYEMNQVKKFSQVTTSHLFLTWNSLCIDTGTGLTAQPRQKWNAGLESLWVSAAARHLLVWEPIPKHRQLIQDKQRRTSSKSRAKITHRKAERRIKGGTGGLSMGMKYCERGSTWQMFFDLTYKCVVSGH